MAGPIEVATGVRIAPPKATPASGVTTKKDSGWQDFAEGVGLSGIELFYGVKDIVSELSDEDKATLKDWQDDAGESGWGTAGQVVGEIGSMIVPGAGWTAGLAKLASKGPKLFKLAKILSNPAASDAVLSAAMAGVRMPGEGEHRGMNAAGEGLLSLGGSAFGEVAKKVVKGTTRTADAKWLKDRGVSVSPGRATEENSLIESGENLLNVIPGSAKAVRKIHARDNASFRKALFKDAHPTGGEILSDGNKGVRELKGAFDSEYSKGWRNSSDLSDDDVIELLEYSKSAREQIPTEQEYLFKRFDETMSKYNESGNPDSRKMLDNALADAIGVTDNKYVADDLKKMRELLRSKLPEEDVAQLRKVDSMYPKYLAIRDASGRAHKKKGNYDYDQLADSAKAVADRQSSGKTGLGKQPFNDYIDAGSDTLGKEMPGNPIGVYRRLVGGAPSPTGLFELMESGIYGEAPWQKALQKIMDNPASTAIRPGRVAGPAGSLLYDD